MKRILLASSAEVFTTISVLERSLIWLVVAAIILGIVGGFLIARQLHPSTVAHRREDPDAFASRS